MDAMMLLRTFAAATTIIAAALVAANWSARIMVGEFAVFILASPAWTADGWLEGKTSLVIQNSILLLINIVGVWRWFPKAEQIRCQPKSRKQDAFEPDLIKRPVNRKNRRA